MAKFILCADSHLGYDYPIKPRIERRRRGKDFVRNFQKILDHTVQTKADFVIHGGDFFFRSKLPEKIISIGYEMLLDFSKYNIPFILVPGNHERAKLPLSILVNTKNILIFDKPRTFTFPKGNINIQIHGFPFIRENIKEQFPGIANSFLANASQEDMQILCMHQIVNGVRLERYVFSHGEHVIPKRIIPLDFDFIVCGHIHRAQILKMNGLLKTVPVIYPGSMERTSFQEQNEDKDFYELICDKRNGDFSYEVNFIKLETRQMMTLNLDQLFQSREELFLHLKQNLSQINPDSIVRVNCKHKEVRKMITQNMIRECAPFSMNVEVYPHTNS